MSNVERRYTTIDKGSWGAGPWQDEPDKVQWTDEATGLPCLVVRGPSGALCGYVGVARAHPYFEVEYSDGPEDALAVHGGITYSDRCQVGDEATSICHIPESGQPDHVWWLGFDCAHSGDYCPAMVGYSYGPSLIPGLPPRWGEAYRDLAYVQAECASLARQLAEAAS